MEPRTFTVSVGWYRCLCGRYYGYEDGHFTRHCLGCSEKKHQAAISLYENQAHMLRVENEELKRSRAALKGVITRKGRKL